MTSFVARFSFPLLAKELVELSARRRTYLVRVIYAVALYGVTLWTYWRWLGQFEADSFEMLGQGQTLFNELLRWQFWGLYLFLPVVTSSAITSEKERDTLSLLLLTKLGSWTILLEKLLSRLVAMGSFLLLGLPLAAVAYSLGGVEIESILKATYVLCVTSLQVASFALLCSTWFRTTSSAFVGTYLLGKNLQRQYYPWLFDFNLIDSLYHDTIFALKDRGFFTSANGPPVAASGDR